MSLVRERLLNLTFRENGMIYSDQPVTNCFIQQNQFREGAEINCKFCENVLQNLLQNFVTSDSRHRLRRAIV